MMKNWIRYAVAALMLFSITTVMTVAVAVPAMAQHRQDNKNWFGQIEKFGQEGSETVGTELSVPLRRILVLVKVFGIFTIITGLAVGAMAMAFQKQHGLQNVIWAIFGGIVMFGIPKFIEYFMRNETLLGP